MTENTGRPRPEMLLHPVRIRVVSELAGHERTVRELTEALPDIAQATLYRHVAALVEGGVLEQSGERAARGPSERVYRLTPGADRLTIEEVDALPAAEQRRMFSVFAASLVESFAAYIDSGGAPAGGDGAAYNRAAVNLSPQERRDFGRRFAELSAEILALPPARHRRRYHLASCVIPAPQGAR